MQRSSFVTKVKHLWQSAVFILAVLDVFNYVVYTRHKIISNCLEFFDYAYIP